MLSGELDAAAPNKSSNKIWLNDGAGNFTDDGQELGDSDREALALADMDGDGDLDIYVANGSGSPD